MPSTEQQTDLVPEATTPSEIFVVDLPEHNVDTSDAAPTATLPDRDIAEVDTRRGHYKYPFKSRKLRRMIKKNPDQFTVHVAEGFDLQRSIDGLDKPIVEVAGPTPAGFYFLDDIGLPSKPHITNVSTILPGEKKRNKLVDDTLDARHMPYEDESISLMLVSCMPGYTSPQETSTSTQRYAEEEPTPQKNDELISKADQEMHEFAADQLSVASVRFSLRTQVYSEVSRVVAGGGLLIINLPRDIDISVLEKLGFNLVAALENDEHRSELVLSGTYIPCFESAVLQKSTTQPEDKL